jgi:hypothetical protein
MSKNKSLKGYVFGALVALVSTTFSVAPAMADANGPVTLLPTQGTTYNTIIGSPISLKSAQDPATFQTTQNAAASASYYVIENPNGAEFTITLAASQTGTAGAVNYIVYDADGVGSVETAGSATVIVTTTSGEVFKTSRTKIAVLAGVDAGTIQNVTIDAVAPASGAVTVPLTVQTLVDQSTTKIGVADGFDRVSAKQAVVLYALGAVSATTTINALTPGVTASFNATVVYGSSVNPFFVQDKTSVAIYKDGTAIDIVDANSVSAVGTTVPERLKTTISATTVNNIVKNVISAGVTTGGAFVSVSAAAVPFAVGIYSAQAFYADNTAGATSMAWDGTAGASTVLDAVKPSVANSTDVLFDAATADKEVSVKSGTKALTINAQLWTLSANAAVAASNIEVKAEISEVKLDATTTITSTGTVASLKKDGSKIIAYARTNNLGKTSFTITSTTGKKADALSVVLFAKKSDGTWSVMDASITGGSAADVDVVWEDAVFNASAFKAKPASYVSGANPTVTFKSTDQFGGAISAVAGKALSVYVVAAFGGVEAPKTYSATVPVINGEASFTFANFAAAGSLAQLKAALFTPISGAGTITPAATATVNVYNTAATSTVNVATSFTTPVTYVDYVVGDTRVAAVATAVSDAGLSSANGVPISGNVLGATGVGQPGVAVTVALDGVLFLADGVYSLNSVTTNANEFGAFSVTAIAHTVYERGATVTITADGKTATTLLITHLPTSIGDDNLSFGWTLPAQVVKNTTYAVTIQLSDKWGNPVAGTTTSGAVSVQGVGSVEVNSVATAVARNFDKNGQTTVFLRSVKDIAGPGAISATLATTGFNYPGLKGVAGASAAIGIFNATDLKSTAWDESLWENSLNANVEVVDVATAAASDTIVNVGTFNGKLVVYALNAAGSEVSYKIAGKWVTQVATSDLLQRYDRVVGATGKTIKVDIYVDGVLKVAKTVVTK